MTLTTKKPSLRRRLRDDAAIQLGGLMKDAVKAINKIAFDVGITAIDLAKMIGSNQTDSLEKALITKLADRKEAALEKIYDAQKAEEPVK